MKTTILTFASAIMLCATSYSQNYEKIFYKDQVKETSDFTITVDNAVSTPGEIKFKLKITNKTNDFVLYKPFESKFILDGKEVKPSEKAMVIKPNSSDFVTINLKGAGYNAIKNYSFVLEGLYKVSTSGKVINTPNFKLPASANEFKTGDFTCTMTDLVKESGKTEVKFKVAYNGNKVGVVNSTKAAVKMPDGKEYANAKKPGMLESKTKEVLLMKGDEETITLKWDKFEGGRAMDMQKVAMEIIWNETYTESPAMKSPSEKLEIEMDEALTVAKNKK